MRLIDWLKIIVWCWWSAMWFHTLEYGCLLCPFKTCLGEKKK
jgi:hypothetical protein